MVFLNFVLVCYIKIFTQHISFQPQIVPITLYTTQSSCIYNYLVLFMDSRNVQSILTKSYTCKFKTTSLPLKVWQTGREVLATFHHQQQVIPQNLMFTNSTQISVTHFIHNFRQRTCIACDMFINSGID